jgi:F1F0 ATPase subunit 2
MINLVLSLLIGAGLGLFYFGGLWLTVRRLPFTRHPILLTLTSLIGRLGLSGLVLSGLLAVPGQYGLLPLTFSMLAFFGIRNILIERFKPR